MSTKIIQEKWLAEAPGRKINPDRAFGLQCVDAADEYAQVIFGVPWQKCVGGVVGANGLPDAVPDEYWLRFDNDPNLPDQIPERGDVIVWAGLGAGSANPYGHVAIVLSADTTGVQVVQQDGFAPPLLNGFSDKPATITRLGYWNAGTGMVMAWLRPKPGKVAGADAPKAVKPPAPAAPAASTAYEFITRFDFPAFTPAAFVPSVFGQGAREILADVIHWWNAPGKGETFESVIADFENNPPNGSSSNFVVTAGRVACGVSEDNASHANGNAWANAKTVTHECNPRCSDADYATIAEHLADRWIARGYTTPGQVFGHNRYFATQCPGDYRIDRIKREASARFVAKRSGAAVPNPSAPAKPRPVKPAIAKPAAKPAPAVTGYVPDPHWVVENGEYMGQIAAWAQTSVEILARYNGIANPDRIVVGEWIWPPVGADTYVVDPGDTLSGIVEFYHAQGHKALTVEKLKNANGINNPATQTIVGRRLQIPK